LRRAVSGLSALGVQKQRGVYHPLVAISRKMQSNFLNCIAAGTSAINGSVVQWNYDISSASVLHDFSVNGIPPPAAGSASETTVKVGVRLLFQQVILPVSRPGGLPRGGA
jgi:hypothetical protein